MNCTITGCDIDHEPRKCATPGCLRAPKRSTGGFVYRNCEGCIANLLGQAFTSEPQSWVERARANQLPTFVVGGVKA